MEMKIRRNNNSHVIMIEGVNKHNGESSYRLVDTIMLIELIGEILLEKKIKVVER